MNILILGSTSGIGQSITNIFADQNNLILVGRSLNKLEKIKNNAILIGALNVNIIEYDLGTDINHLIINIENYEIDLLINIASSTSNYRDNAVKSSLIKSDVGIDLINPILLTQWLIDRSNRLNIIFISSILSKIKSPNRIIYSSLKNLQETYLNKIATENFNKVNLLTVTVGTEINKYKESMKSRKLAKKLFIAFTKRKENLFFGLSGKVLYYIYYLNPFLFSFIIHLKRKIIPSNVGKK